MRPQKSNNRLAQYMHRGVYINKISYGRGWFVHFADARVAGLLPKGLHADTLEKLVFLIDRALKGDG